MCLYAFEVDGHVVHCRKCWQCRSAYLQDWKGRLIAESRAAKHTMVCALTYGESDLYHPGRWASDVDQWRAFKLVYDDVVKWRWQMRKYSRGFRFFVTGEYGPLKGRSHWHVVAFFDELPPNLRLDERYVHWAETPEQAAANKSRYKRGSPLWRWGWSYWQEADLGGLEYVCKYLLKDLAYSEAETEKAFGLSKLPPLGWRYFTEHLAGQYVEQGLSPQVLEYDFDDVFETKAVKGATGVAKREVRSKFQLLKRSASARMFLDAYVIKFFEKHGHNNWPQSELLDDHVDDMERRERRANGLADRTDFQFGREFLVKRLAKRGIVLPYYGDSRERDVWEDMDIRRDVLARFERAAGEAGGRPNRYAGASQGL